MNKMAIHLEKLAEDVDAQGLTQSKTDSMIKIASAAEAVRKLSMFDLPKILAGAAALSLGTKAVGSTMDSISGKIDDVKYEHKKEKTIIPFAKKQHPGLKNIPDSKLGNWLDSARAMAPKVSTDKMLASTYLNNVHALGGQVDIHTAGTLSQIGKNTSSKGSMSDMIGGNIGGASSLLLGAPDAA